MVPVSLGRASSLRPERRDFVGLLAWLRPANVTSARRADLRAQIAWLALFVALGVGVALVHVWLRLQVVDLGYRLSATRQLIGKLEQEGHELTLEVASLEAPSHVEQVARSRLGMTRPEKGREAVLP
jgi:cell division protein FtsL